MQDIHEIMTERRLIAILRGVPEEMLCDVLDAVYDGGVRLAEITYDFSGKTADGETAKMIARAVRHTEGRMLIGAGTVTRESQLALTKEAGGRFIISPNTDTEIIRRTKSLGLTSIPGAMTVSEIVSALQAGADYVKLFPAGCFGPEFVKNVLSPLKGSKLLAVSGVTPENIPDYLAAGCCGFGIGGGIVNAKLCAGGRLGVIRENAAKFAAACIRGAKV